MVSVAEGSLLKTGTYVGPQMQRHKEAGDGGGVGTKEMAKGLQEDLGPISTIVYCLFINSN